MKNKLGIAIFVVIVAAAGWYVLSYNSATQTSLGKHCGGNIANPPTCDAGYHCAPDPASHAPFGDVGGTCVADTPAPSVTYHNSQYGFQIVLPSSWKNYTVQTSTWNGQVYNAAGTQTGTDKGPEIVLHYPGDSTANPHEAMPIMVFTPSQWALVSAGDANPAKPFMAVGAAPIGPSELSHNSKFYLALPARYNYDYKPGYQEVDTLIHTLTAF